MKKQWLAGLIVFLWVGMAQAVINVGTGPTFVYQKDVSSNQDASSLLSDAEFNGLQWFENTDKAWIGQSGNAEDRYLTLHFQAPEGYSIQSAQVFTRSYLRDDHWENVSLKATWGTTELQFPWDYLFQNTQFYYRQNSHTGTGVWTDENTATLPVGGASNLYLTFDTFQDGYAAMDWSKEWFVSDNTGTYNPGLVVTLTIQGPPIKGDANGDRVVDTADIAALKALVAAGTTDLQYDLNGDGAVGQADVDYLAHNLLNQPLNGPIQVGAGSTFVYQRDVSSNKDGKSLLNETEYNELQWFENADKAWIGQSGNAEERYLTFHFQAPEDYLIQAAQVFTRSYVRDDHWETVSVKATWGTEARQFPWDYLFQNPQFYYRVNSGTGTGLWTDENTATLPVGGKSDLYLTFGTYQSGYGAMDWSKGWFISPGGESYDPGLKVTLSMVPVETVMLDTFESGSFMWTRAEPNDQFSVSRQSAVSYAGNYAMDFHIDHTANNGYWSRVQGIFPAGQDWTRFKKVVVKVKSSVAGATAFIGWDFLINGVADANRVNGSSGCGSFVLPSDTEWHSFTLDLTPWTRDNVTGLEFYIRNDQCIAGSFDIYIDDIKLVSDAPAPTVTPTPTPTTTPTPAQRPGDANTDGKVDVSDLGILAANYGTTSGATWNKGDFNNDGKVDVSDLGILAANYGAGTGVSLDFNADAKALGLPVDAKEDAAATSTLGCGSVGLPLAAGLLLAGLLLGGLTCKE